MPFRSAVESTDGLAGAYRLGLQALERADRGRLEVTRTHDLCGSAAIDTALQATYPVANRWDYIVCQSTQRVETAHFIEVHPATKNDHVREVAAKAEWLLDWLQATPLASIERQLHWVATGTVAFNRRNPALKILAKSGVVLRGSTLKL